LWKVKPCNKKRFIYIMGDIDLDAGFVSSSLIMWMVLLYYYSPGVSTNAVVMTLISTLCSAGLPVVLKLSWNQQLSWNFTHLVRMSWYGPLFCCRYTFFTSHDYVYVADVECQVMFFLVTFMCNIALVTFLGLQYWSAMSTERRAFSVLILVKLTKVS